MASLSVYFPIFAACVVSTSFAHRIHEVRDSMSSESDLERPRGKDVALANWGFRQYKKSPGPDQEDIHDLIDRILGSPDLGTDGHRKTWANVRPNIGGHTWDMQKFNTYEDLVVYVRLNIMPDEKSNAWHTCKLTGPEGSSLAAAMAVDSCTTCRGALFGDLFAYMMPGAFEAKPSNEGRMCYCSVKKGTIADEVGEPTVMGFPTGGADCNEQYCWQVYATIYNAKNSRKNYKVDRVDNWQLKCPACSGGEETCENSVQIANTVFKTPEQLKELKEKADKGDQDAKDELDAIRSAGVVFTVETDTVTDDNSGKPGVVTPTNPTPSDRAEIKVIDKEQERRDEECKKRKIATPCSEEDLEKAIKADVVEEEKKSPLADQCKKHKLPKTCDEDDLSSMLAMCEILEIDEANCNQEEIDKKLTGDMNDAREEEVDADDIIDAAVKEGVEVECTKYGLPKDCGLNDREMHRKIRTAYPEWPKEKPTCKDEDQLDDRLSNDCRKCLLMGRCRQHVSCMRKCPRTCDSKYGQKRGQSECHNAVERVKKRCQKKLNREQDKGCFGGNNGKTHDSIDSAQKALHGRDFWMTVPDLCEGEADGDDQFFFEDPWEERKDYEEGVPHPVPDGMSICDFIR